MGYLIVIGIIVIVTAFISWRWVVGIDYMHKNHPDYKGDDFLNWRSDEEENENDKTQIL
jgi:hypothetical protein